MNILDYPHIGNADLLQCHKTAFLASSHISTLSVLPTLEWATAMARRKEEVVVSGFSSRMEQEVLNILLRGKCGIILVLGRQLYKRLPYVWQKLLKDNRLLIISTSKQVRQSRQAAKVRNERVCEVADEVLVPCVPPTDSSLYEIYEKYEPTSQIKVIL